VRADIKGQRLGPVAAYYALMDAGEIHADEDQLDCVEKFEELFLALRDYPEITEKSLARRHGFLAKIFGGSASNDSKPKGLYLYGGVGRGKSMLMDLFYETAPTEHKRRVHFHEFMQEVHARLKVWRKRTPDERVAAGASAKDDNPIPPVAREIALGSTLICFDEMQVTDIADAMVLQRLFSELFALGVIVVTTSNRHPSDLYMNGLNRQLFLPCIEMFKAEFDLCALDGETDYRLNRLKGLETYYFPADDTATAALRAAFMQLTDRSVDDTSLVPSAELEVMGRSVHVPRSARGVAVFSFKRLCASATGAADYLAIARHYHTVIMVGIPVLTKDKRNEAKRFVTFIDALYEHNVKFLCSAAAPAENLYPEGDGSFEFERTVSRLMEMQSADYMARGHGLIDPVGAN